MTMDPLLKAVKLGSLEAVKIVVASKGIPFDSRWIDYLALNYAIVADHIQIAWFLLDQHCRVKNSHENVLPHETPLHSAVKRDCAILVTKLLDKGASIKTLNDQGYSPLHLAFILKREEAIDAILNFILRKGEYDNTASTKGLTHFHVACTTKNVAVIRGFIESGVDVTVAVDESSDYRPGYTAKHFAVEFQSLEAVRELVVKTGPEQSRVLDRNRQSPEELAKKALEELSVIVYLLTGESRPDGFNSQTQMSPFHLACAQDNPKLVKKFIENGAAVNNVVSKNANLFPGYSPLHFAVESNCKENVELLLKEGADVEHQDVNFRTPLHLALYNEDPGQEDTIVDLLFNRMSIENKMFNIMDTSGLNYFHIAVTRNEVDLIETFLNSGVNIEHEVLFNHRQFTHYKPLHFAVRYKHFETTELLIERGANVDAISKDGPPLQIAIEVGDMDLVDLLLDSKARVDVVRHVDGKTVLQSLVENYMKSPVDVNENTSKNLLLDFIELIIDFGCDVNHRDCNGNTALHIACEKISNGIDCVRLLLNFGADINLENKDGETPFNYAFHDYYRHNAESYMMLYHHVQKFKVLGLPVNSKNETCCQKILDESNECDPSASCFRMMELQRKKLQRRQEIMNLKNTPLTEAMSLYDFLRLNRVDAASFVTNEKMKAILRKANFDDEYPVYGYLIRLQFFAGAKYLKYIRNNMNVDDHSNETRSTMRKRGDS